MFTLIVNTASIWPSGESPFVPPPTRSTTSPWYARDVLPDDGGRDAVWRTVINVGALTFPTTSVAVSESVSFTAAEIFVANEPSPIEVPVAVEFETVSLTLMTRPPPLTAPADPCTSEMPPFGGSAKIKLPFGAAGAVCMTLIVTDVEAVSPAKFVAVAVIVCGPSGTPARLNVPWYGEAVAVTVWL